MPLIGADKIGFDYPELRFKGAFLALVRAGLEEEEVRFLSFYEADYEELMHFAGE